MADVLMDGHNGGPLKGGFGSSAVNELSYVSHSGGPLKGGFGANAVNELSYVSDDAMDISGNEKEGAASPDREEHHKALSAVIDMLSRVMSQERLKLSMAVRNAVEEEIHGVRCRAVEETPALVSQSLESFRKELEAAPDDRRHIYDRIATAVAERRGQEFHTNHNSNNHRHPTKHYATEDEEFRLRFLRCELFDAKKAVERFLNYLILSEELWGFDIVSQRLVVRADFSKEDYKYLRKGFIQLLPFRDRSGRRVIVLSADPLDPDETNVSRETMLRCYLYVVDIAGRDSVESQQRGAVWMSDPNGMVSQIKNRFPVFTGFTRAMPTRVVAGHHFLPDLAAYRMFEYYLLALHSAGAISNRVVRHKFYVGYTKLEMDYRLLGYGIPTQYMPWTDTGKIKLKYWNGWLKLRTLIESGHAQDRALVIVECPGMNDVVFRHGQSYKKFHGNDTLREWIESELLCRNNSSGNTTNTSKTSIDQFCDRLIDEIKNNQKGRFLKWDNSLNSWVQMLCDVEIKKKISASFYNFSKRNYNTFVQPSLSSLAKQQQLQKQQQQQQQQHRNIGIRVGDGEYKFIDVDSRIAQDLCSTTRLSKKPRSEMFFNN